MSLLKIDDVIVDTIAKENGKNATSTIIQEVVQTIHQVLKSKSSVRLFFTKPTYQTSTYLNRKDRKRRISKNRNVKKQLHRKTKAFIATFNAGEKLDSS